MATDEVHLIQRVRGTGGRRVIRSFVWMCVAGAAVCNSASAVTASGSHPGAATGEALLRDLMGPLPENDHLFLNSTDIVKHEKARGYVYGVKDESEGTQWCFTGDHWKELDQDIVSALKKLTPAQRRGPAAPMVIKILGERFPCTPVGSGK